MKRAQPLEGSGAGALEHHVRTDDVVDTRAGPDLCDVLVVDQSGHTRSLPSPPTGFTRN